MLPEENVGLFISYSGGNYLTHTAVFQAFMDHYFPVNKTAADPLPPEGTLERSEKFIGEYHQNRKSFTTPEKFLSLTMGMVHIELDDDGYLLVTNNGVTNRFVEIEPDIYQNLREGRTGDPYGNFDTDGPITYSKAPWYASSGFTFLSVIITVLFFVFTLIYWVVAAVIRKFRRKKVHYPKTAVFAKWLAIVYGMLILGIVFGIVTTGAVDPVYQLSNDALGISPPWSQLLDFIPLIMTIVGVAMVIFTVLVWWKSYWKRSGRIHYTLLTILAMYLLWIFSFWNLYEV